MIKTVIRFPLDVVIVLDENGEQITAYQGPYGEVRDLILRDAPGSACFYHAEFRFSQKALVAEEW